MHPIKQCMAIVIVSFPYNQIYSFFLTEHSFEGRFFPPTAAAVKEKSKALCLIFVIPYS
jgi:hypothetical protein